ncbi:Line-1 reverse transcriptase isogeny, partial [Thalictrum thalictroides]
GVRGWSNLPWVIGGDFNITRFTFERKGGGRMTQQMKLFDDFMDRNSMVDYPIKGALFTWANSQSASRIDRFVSSVDWDTEFSQANELAMERFESDHRVIMLKCNNKSKGSSPFRFELMWFEEDDLVQLIDEWLRSFPNEGCPSFNWWKKVKLLKVKLKEWNRETFGRIDKLLDEKSKEVDSLDAKEEASQLSLEEEGYRALLKEELNNLLNKADISFRQKFRIKWRIEGECNTSHFHKYASMRNREDSISNLQIKGENETNEVVIEKHIID